MGSGKSGDPQILTQSKRLTKVLKLLESQCNIARGQIERLQIPLVEGPFACL